MTHPVESDSDILQDYASRGPVRAFAMGNLLTAYIFVTVATAVCLAASAADAAHPSRSAKRPSVASVTRAIESYFASLTDYENGDVITRSQVERVLTKLDAAGAPIPKAGLIVANTLDDNSFLARQLTTAQGRSFIRRLAKSPGAYSRLDRLSTIPGGEALIRDLSRDKGGDKLIAYLSTTKGGRAMGSMMAGVPGGANLNKPTGRIYTVADLLSAVRAAYVSEPIKNVP